MRQKTTGPSRPRPVPELDETLWAFLTDQPPPAGRNGFRWLHLEHDDQGEARDGWERFGRLVLDRWV